MKKVNIKIYGRVQGVFFRHNTKKVADRLKLRGLVRNNQDGTVDVVAEGDDKHVGRFIAWCRKGPIGAKVENVEVKEEKYRKEFKDFSIVY
jgi:acylphosphatase